MLDVLHEVLLELEYSANVVVVTLFMELNYNCK